MPEVLATMIRRHRVSRGAGDSPQRRSAARCVGPNVSFDETPRGLDRIEIVRIWWQPFHACAALFDVERHLGRPLAFFLSTKSARRIARPKLVRVVRADGDARRLYAQHSSATVASGASRTMISSIAMSIGQRQPPPLGRGATDPVARSRATHRCSVRYPTPKSRASSWYPPSPASYAATARSRNVISYDCDMPTLKYNGRVNSSGHRD